MKNLIIILTFLIAKGICEFKTHPHPSSEDQNPTTSDLLPDLTTQTNSFDVTTLSTVDNFVEIASTQIYEATTDIISETTTKLDTCESLQQDISIIQDELNILEEKFNKTTTKCNDELKLLDENLKDVLKATEKFENFKSMQNQKIEEEFENFNKVYKYWIRFQERIMSYEGGMYGLRYNYSEIKECQQNNIKNFDSINYKECVSKFPAIVQNITEQEVEMLEDFKKLQSLQSEMSLKWKKFLEFDDAQKKLILENREKFELDFVKQSELKIKINEKKSSLKEIKKPFDASIKKLNRKLRGKTEEKLKICSKFLWVPLASLRTNEVIGGHDEDGKQLKVIRSSKTNENFLYGKLKEIPTWNRNNFKIYVIDGFKETELSSSDSIYVLTAPFYKWCKVTPTHIMTIPVCRANFRDSITPGTLISNSLCRIGFGFKAHDFYSPDFEILKETECL